MDGDLLLDPLGRQTLAQVKELLAGKPGPWPQGWQAWPNVAQAFRFLFAEAATKAKTLTPPRWDYNRGIVICGGGWRFFPSLYVTCRVIRQVGCKLPIQIWHLSGERYPKMDEILESVGGDIWWVDGQEAWRDRPEMQLRDMAGFDDPWMMKPFAAAFSSFAEVISLDADSYPAYDPQQLLAQNKYRRVGNCFFPDNAPLKAEQWERFGIPPHKCPSVESGQFIVDKRRHWAALWLSCWLAAHHDYVWDPHGKSNQGHIYGDKDCFNLAWRKLGFEMLLPTRRPSWKAHSYLHHDFAGKTVFVHRCQDKFRLAQLNGQEIANNYHTPQKGKENVYVAELPLEDFCWSALEECRIMLTPPHPYSCIREADPKPLEVIRVDLPGHYNSSIAEYGGKLWLASRKAQHIWLSELSPKDWQPRSCKRLDLAHPLARQGAEDPRLFVYGGDLYVSFSGVEMPGEPRRIHMMYASVAKLDIQVPMMIDVRDKTLSNNISFDSARRGPVEKNWVFFEWGRQLWSVYSPDPHRIDLHLAHDGQAVAREHVTHAVWPEAWKGWLRRGGAAPVPYGEEHYCWFHGVRPRDGLNEYAIGLYTFASRPPFEIRRVSIGPIMTPVPHHGRRQAAIFPCGAILRDDVWAVSYGYNDFETHIALFDAGQIEAKLARAATVLPQQAVLSEC